MKKTKIAAILLVVLMLVSTLPVVVGAEGADAVNIIVGSATAAVGESFKIDVTIDDVTGICLALTLDYDKNALELDAANSKWNNSGFIAHVTKEGNAVFANGTTDFSGKVLTLAFKVKASAVNGEYTIGLKNAFLYKNDEVVIDTAVTAGTVTVTDSVAEPVASFTNVNIAPDAKTVEVLFNINKSNVASFALTLNYNKDVLTLNAEKSVALAADVMADFGGTQADTCVVMSKKAVDYDGAVLKLVFDVKDAVVGEKYIIAGGLKLAGEAASAVKPSEITVGLRGDFDGDNDVDADDAIYLLMYTMLGDAYPIKQSGDVNGDGVVNQDDAIQLLMFTMLPDMYPLK